jgi:hypothetical protein
MLTTFAGVPLLDIYNKLDEPLPKEAYKPLTGGKGQVLGLTDIDPSYWLDQIVAVFGPPGAGFWMDVLEQSCERRTTAKGTEIHAATAKVAMQYVIFDVETRTGWSKPVYGVGAHEDSNPEWAMKGALTSAKKTAWQALGSQRSVWKGQRSHQQPQGGTQPQPVPPSPLEVNRAKLREMMVAASPAATPGERAAWVARVLGHPRKTSEATEEEIQKLMAAIEAEKAANQ